MECSDLSELWICAAKDSRGFVQDGSEIAKERESDIQLGGCFLTITHKDLTSTNCGRFIRSHWIVALPTSVSATMTLPLTDQSK